MPKYMVIGHANATVSRTVEADSPEAAAEKRLPSESVCYQCSRTLNVSEVYRVQVIETDGNGDVVFDTDPDREEELKRENAELREQCRKLTGALANAKKGKPRARKVKP